ncbi:interleukin 17a/f3 [Acanthopagrus latus]|uniref:interleukin 17a/f3 n=1 Tax=Acanthopagrus latus TaxID=8177 RepID=UPI00187D0073|nr:interleukin 17a/f3 [Acanthopagrus latus]XP_036942408.1 interleukin 17a/f3 [Acanthopagrus latus]XP_036942409.1 interleukin 17a/f3 [Acanthopagrus latus]XP_036942410.1 interleukin 17a/f3 [Acanthopagrus latus]
MALVFRALLVLGLATLLHAGRRGQTISVKLGRGTGLRGRTVRLHLDPSVQTQISSTTNSDIADMSLTPWTYRESCEPARLPQQISHAQCLTSGCLSLQGGAEDAALEAQPIYYQALVLHRVQRLSERGGRKLRRSYSFRLKTERIPVGCTCVRPSVVLQQ